MSFVDAIKSVFSHYVDFSGRARRSEYWYFFLFTMLVNVVTSGLAAAVDALSFVQIIASLAMLLPGLAVAVRRLHDIGKSGWCLLFVLIPLVGSIILIVWYCKDSQPGDNQYGPNPKGVSGATASM